MNSRLLNIVLPIVAVIVYILIDFVYVYLARSRYEEAVVVIQKGAKMEIDAVAALVCYTVMALGWCFITFPLALAYYDKLKQRTASWTPFAASALGGLVAGALYGFVVYGVFSLTTRALFANQYPISLVIQDIAWGTLFNMVFTAVYMIIWRKLTNPVEL